MCWLIGASMMDMVTIIHFLVFGHIKTAFLILCKGCEVMESIIEALHSMSDEELLEAHKRIAELIGLAEASLLQLLIEMELDARSNG